MFLCQDGEKKGVNPEEVYTSMRVAGDSSILPCKWLKTELPLLLDQIRMLVATSSLTTAEHTVSLLLSLLPSHLCPPHLSMTHRPLTQNRSGDAPTEDAGKEVDPAETESVVQLSRAEAKQAWLTAGGDTERAAKQALKDRLAKVTRLPK